LLTRELFFVKKLRYYPLYMYQKFIQDREWLSNFITSFQKNSVFFYSIIVIIMGFFTYFNGYNQPPSLFWDENYHVSSAERYLQGKFFMEPHPPLGKLIIAMGEKLINPNANIDKTAVAVGDAKDDSIPHIAEIPAGFKFDGYRFFPALAAWLCCFLLFWLLYILLSNEHLAFLFTLPYVFDNAIVVHSRGAMLDGIQMFFILAALIWFAKMWKEDRRSLADFGVYGILLGLNVATKLNGLILIIPPLALFLKDSFTWDKSLNAFLLQKIRILIFGLAAFYLFYLTFGFTFNQILLSRIGDLLKDSIKDATELAERSETWLKVLNAFFAIIFVYFTNEIFESLKLNTEKLDYTQYRELFNKIADWIKKSVLIAAIVVGIFGSVFYIHFSLSNTIVSTNNFSGYVKEDYKRVIEKSETGLITNFTLQLRDHLEFAKRFQAGVPKLDLTKGDGENGSSPWTWPLGNKSIRYMMAWSNTCQKPDYKDPTCRFSYIYLIPNIFAWGMCLIGILLCLMLIFGKLIFGIEIKDKNLFSLILVFVVMYAGYMFQIAGIDRVLYLYHYFIPLIFSLIASALLFKYITENNKYKELAYTALVVFMILLIINFIYFSPFTYKLDLSPEEFKQHNWFKFWNLKMEP
jgi:dolichyl-phosphate-mannose--protein O-mannosyl transferase